MNTTTKDQKSKRWKRFIPVKILMIWMFFIIVGFLNSQDFLQICKVIYFTRCSYLELMKGGGCNLLAHYKCHLQCVTQHHTLYMFLSGEKTPRQPALQLLIYVVSRLFTLPLFCVWGFDTMFAPTFQCRSWQQASVCWVTCPTPPAVQLTAESPALTWSQVKYCYFCTCS